MTGWSAHQQALTTTQKTRYQPQLLGKRVPCLDIPDNYKFMDAALVKLLKMKVERHLP